MRLGPLRFLACVAAGTMAWAVSRVPVIVERARADVAAAKAWAAAAQGPTGRLALVRAVRRTSPRPPSCHSGERRNPFVSQAQSYFIKTRVGSGVHPIDANPRQPAAVAETELPLPHPFAVITLPIPEVAAVVPPAVAANQSTAAFDLATAAYSDLARRDRRAASRGFSAALAAAPEAPGAAAWRTELRGLRKRWSGEAYTLVRDAGPAGLGVAPLLGGGQSGGSLAYTPDPLARRPFAVVARIAVAHESADFGIAGVDRTSLQTALGIRWQVAPGASLTAERLIAGGAAARDAWVLRAAGGAVGKVGPVLIDAYAEAGIVGARRRDHFTSAQARAVVPLPAGFDAGAGTWASVQDADTTVHRVDLGPSLGWRYGPIAARADWRFRVSGKAAPGSGPTLTVSAGF